MPSQSQSSQPILPTVVVPSPPAILTSPEAEDQDEDLGLPTLAQEETNRQSIKEAEDWEEEEEEEASLGILPDMILHLHPIIRTIQQICRYNMKVRKN